MSIDDTSVLVQKYINSAYDKVVTVYNNIADVIIVADNVADVTSFSVLYLGAKSSVPVVDNSGNALITGAMYFNSTSDTMFVRTSGAAWAAL